VRNGIVRDADIEDSEPLDRRCQQRRPDVRHQRDDGNRPLACQPRQERPPRSREIRNQPWYRSLTTGIEFEVAIAELVQPCRDLARSGDGQGRLETLAVGSRPGQLQRKLAKASVSPEEQECNAHGRAGVHSQPIAASANTWLQHRKRPACKRGTRSVHSAPAERASIDVHSKGQYRAVP